MKKLQMDRKRLIALHNVHVNIREPEEAQYTAKFKIRLYTNRDLLRSEMEVIVKVLNDKLKVIKDQRDSKLSKYWLTDDKGKYKPVQANSVLFGCVAWPENELKAGIGKDVYSQALNDILQLPENKKVMDELEDFLNEQTEINLHTYHEDICPDSLSGDFYAELTILTEV